MSDVDLIIDVRGGEDGDLLTVLSQHGVRTRPHYGTFNGPMPDLSEMLKHPAPYIWATATAAVLKTAIKAYADSKKKRFIISRLKTGIKVDATNYSVDELKDMGFLILESLRRMTVTANKRVERTAATRFSFDGDGLQTAVVAVVSALPAAVAHPCRSTPLSRHEFRGI